MNLFHTIKDAVLHYVYPHVCVGCGTDVLSVQSQLCLYCIQSLPVTNFETMPKNPVEKIFYGRVPLQAATAYLYFSKTSITHELVHAIKYKRNKELGLQMGAIMGEALKLSGRFPVDAVIPLPLYPKREKKRGYNQATLLATGIAQALEVPCLERVIKRSRKTETQTKKNRIERVENMINTFTLMDPQQIANKHVLLVDDVVTTGATLESCATTILQAPQAQLSIASLCFATAS